MKNTPDFTPPIRKPSGVPLTGIPISYSRKHSPENEIKHLSKEIANLNTNVSFLNKKLAEQKGNYLILEESLKKSKESNTLLENKNNILYEEVAKFAALIKDLDFVKSLLEERIKICVESNNELEDRVKKCIQSNKDQDEYIKALEAKIKIIVEENKELEKDDSDL